MFVSLNETPINKPKTPVFAHDKISIKEKKAQNQALLRVDILYEDDEILVLNKPKNLVVHPAAGHSGLTLVDWLLERNFTLSSLDLKRPGIVHRLDKNTTGAIVVAKTNKAHENLKAQLQTRSLGRYYLAIIEGKLKNNISVDACIGRSLKNRTTMSVQKCAKPAKTVFSKICLSNDGQKELIAAKLFTGRTHQIRVHLRHIGQKILGDETYGDKNTKFSLMLHAFLLHLKHPSSQENLLIKAPLQEDFNNVIEQFFNKEKTHAKLNQASILSSFDSL